MHLFAQHVTTNPKSELIAFQESYAHDPNTASMKASLQQEWFSEPLQIWVTHIQYHVHGHPVDMQLSGPESNKISMLSSGKMPSSLWTKIFLWQLSACLIHVCLGVVLLIRSLVKPCLRSYIVKD